MKNVLKFAALAAVLVFDSSCESEGDNTIDQVFDGVTNGAVLRTVQIIANELPLGSEDASFSVLLEAQDNQDGDLLESVDFWITFADGSPEEGDSSAANTDEIFVRNIPASEFDDGPFGLPRVTYTLTLPEMLSLVGLTNDAIFGGDTFTTRVALNLTDGRVFSTNNATGIIQGGFFASPFTYTTPVVCPVGAEEFIGDYTLFNVVQSDFGNIYAEESTVTLVSGETSVDRSFSAVVLEDLAIGQDPTPLNFQMICNEVVVGTAQPTGLGCGGSLLLDPPIAAAPGTYTTGDDSVFNIVMGYNVTGEATCAVPLDIEIRLEKQ